MAATLFVACTLRSGSNLLCAMLYRNGFGVPAEWFQAPDSDGSLWCVAGTQAVASVTQVERFLAAQAGMPWQALKLDWGQFLRVRSLAAEVPAMAQVLERSRRGRWIFLRRRDLAAQAVSLYAAQASGTWMGEASEAHAELRYDFDVLHEHLARLAAEEFCWADYFRSTGIKPLELYFEDMIASAPAAWLALFRCLTPDFDAERLDLSALAPPVRAVAQLDAIKSRFRSDLLAGRQAPPLSALADQMSALVSRMERTAAPDPILSRFVREAMHNPCGFTLHKLDVQADLDFEGDHQMIAEQHFLDGVAVRLDAHGTCRFASAGGGRLMIQFLAHGWSGVAEIGVGDEKDQIDLYAERAGTRNYVRDVPEGFHGPVSVRATGRRNLLSEGWEVWVQRVFVLEDRPRFANSPPLPDVACQAFVLEEAT